MAAKEKDLEPVKDKKVIERYLRYTVDFRERMLCFFEPEELHFEAAIQSFDPGNFTATLEITAETFSGLSSESLKKLEKGQVRLSFTVNEVLFFAHAAVTGRKTRQLEVRVDTPIFKMQRRGAVRIKIADSHKASVNVDGKEYLLHDLSASGLSFVVMGGDEALFPEKRLCKGCALQFLSLKAVVDMEAIGAKQLSKNNDQLFRVGFKFLRLPAAAEQFIAKEAYLYTHKIWARWI